MCSQAERFLLATLAGPSEYQRSLDRKNCYRDGVVSCVLCSSGSRETSDHLFFRCNFSTTCWASISFDPLPQGSFSNIIKRARSSVPARCYKEVCITACWYIWKQRNGLIFNQLGPSRASWFQGFKEELIRQSVHFPDTSRTALMAWLVSVSFVP